MQRGAEVIFIGIVIAGDCARLDSGDITRRYGSKVCQVDVCRRQQPVTTADQVNSPGVRIAIGQLPVGTDSKIIGAVARDVTIARPDAQP